LNLRYSLKTSSEHGKPILETEYLYYIDVTAAAAIFMTEQTQRATSPIRSSMKLRGTEVFFILLSTDPHYKMADNK
jgi:hypothetical protein